MYLSLLLLLMPLYLPRPSKMLSNKFVPTSNDCQGMTWTAIHGYELTCVLGSVRPLSGRDYSLSVVSINIKYQQKDLIFCV